MVLSLQAGVSIIGQESNLDRAIQSIHTLRPDLVLVASHNNSDNPALAIARISQETLVKIIAINLESNGVQVYGEHQQECRHSDYLAQAIQAEILTANPAKSPLSHPLSGGKNEG